MKKDFIFELLKFISFQLSSIKIFPALKKKKSKYSIFFHPDFVKGMYKIRVKEKNKTKNTQSLSNLIFK